jgi:RNA polymerase sigma factor (sigma-70 family)
MWCKCSIGGERSRLAADPRVVSAIAIDRVSEYAGRPSLRSAPARQLSDEQLAELMAAGDREAFAVAYDRHFPALVKYCRGILLSREDAEDAAQSAMLAALRTLPNKPAAVNLRAWLFRVARNEAIDQVRSRRAHDSLEDAGDVSTTDTAVVAETRARLSELVRDLRALPERQRGALVMREFCGLEYHEIATAIGASEAAAMQTVFEARSALVVCEEGRSLACEGVQRIISDGDKRSMRARRVRAHMRNCDGCRAFETSVTRRRRDYCLLLPGAAAVAGKGGLAAVLGLVRVHSTASSGKCAAFVARIQGASGLRGAAVGAALCVAAGGGVVAVAHHGSSHRPPAHAAVPRPMHRVAARELHVRFVHAPVHVRPGVHASFARHHARRWIHHRRVIHLRAPAPVQPLSAAAPVAAPAVPSSASTARRPAPVSVAVSAGSGHVGVHLAASVGRAASVTGDVSVGASPSGVSAAAAVSAKTPVAAVGVSATAGTQTTPSGTTTGAHVGATICLLSCQ